MNRHITQKLLDWYRDDYRKPLLLRGARQVGKTFLVEQFAAKYFKQHFLKLDFEARPELKEIFKENREPKNIIPKLELIFDLSITPEKTLIFFDEIQECPDALISLRYFYEQLPKLHLIAAGSLLEFAFEEISFPVGRVNLLNVFPLTFSEFLLALGKEKMAKMILSAPYPLSNAEHHAVLNDYAKFLYVGGFPEAVKKYSETGSFVRAREFHAEIVKLYESDFAKYAGKASIDCMRQIFRSVAFYLTKPVKYSQLSADFSVPTIKKSLELLSLAQVVDKIPAVNPHGLPLGATASQKLFKILLVDIGLLHGLSGFRAEKVIERDSILDAYRGALAEQALGQALINISDRELFTWYRPEPGSTAEVDFLLSRHQEVIPIEIKSGSIGKLKSLHLFLAQYKLAHKALVFSIDNFEQNVNGSKIDRVPLYWAEGVKWS